MLKLSDNQMTENCQENSIRCIKKIKKIREIFAWLTSDFYDDSKVVDEASKLNRNDFDYIEQIYKEVKND